jgi:hypothetical protein
LWATAQRSSSQPNGQARKASSQSARPASTAAGLVAPEKLETNPRSGQFTGTVHFLEVAMNGLIYLVGLVVVILAILSFFGLR